MEGQAHFNITKSLENNLKWSFLITSITRRMLKLVLCPASCCEVDSTLRTVRAGRQTGESVARDVDEWELRTQRAARKSGSPEVRTVTGTLWCRKFENENQRPKSECN